MRNLFLVLVIELFSSINAISQNQTSCRFQSHKPPCKYCYDEKVFIVTFKRDKPIKQIGFKLQGFQGIFTPLHGVLATSKNYNDLKKVTISEIIVEGEPIYDIQNNNGKDTFIITRVLYQKDLAYFELKSKSSRDQVLNYTPSYLSIRDDSLGFEVPDSFRFICNEEPLYFFGFMDQDYLQNKINPIPTNFIIHPNKLEGLCLSQEMSSLLDTTNYFNVLDSFYIWEKGKAKGNSGAPIVRLDNKIVAYASVVSDNKSCGGGVTVAPFITNIKENWKTIEELKDYLSKTSDFFYKNSNFICSEMVELAKMTHPKGRTDKVKEGNYKGAKEFWPKDHIREVPLVVNYFLHSGDFVSLEKECVGLNKSQSQWFNHRIKKIGGWTISYVNLVDAYNKFLFKNKISTFLDTTAITDAFYERLDSLSHVAQVAEDSFKVVFPSRIERKIWQKMGFDYLQAQKDIMRRILSFYEESGYSEYLQAIKSADSLDILKVDDSACELLRLYQIALSLKKNDSYALKKIGQLTKKCIPKTTVDSSEITVPKGVKENNELSDECIKILTDSFNRLVSRKHPLSNKLFLSTYLSVDGFGRQRNSSSSEPELKFKINIGSSFDNFLVNYSYKQYPLGEFNFEKSNEDFEDLLDGIDFLLQFCKTDKDPSVNIVGHSDATPYRGAFNWGKFNFTKRPMKDSVDVVGGDTYYFEDLVRSNASSDDKNIALAYMRGYVAKEYYKKKNLLSSKLKIKANFHSENINDGTSRGINFYSKIYLDMDKVKKLCY